MATKITITIPDDLAQRLQPLRDRMNISKICAAAIEREVSILTDLPQDVRDFTHTIARIKADKEKTLEGDYKSGFERGVDYGRSKAGYRDYVKYAEIAELLQGTVGLHRKYLKLPDNEEESLEEDIREQLVLVADRHQFRRGWLDGLLEVWAVIKDKV